MTSATAHIVAAAYRHRHPRTGIGGAGGALQIQEALFGPGDRHLRFDYCFTPPSPPSIEDAPAVLRAALSTARDRGLDTPLPSPRSLQDLPASWLTHDRYVPEAVVWGRQMALARPSARFFVHEPATACGLAAAGAVYSLVYHHQGSLATEQTESFGRSLAPGALAYWSLIERIAMRAARRVYFPSLGARDAFLASAGISEADVGRIGPPLYNTILSPADEAGAAEADLLGSLPAGPGLFVSIGAFSPAKGLDRVPAFLADYSRLSGRPVWWLARGDGPGREQVIDAVARAGLTPRAFLVEHRIANTTLRAILQRASGYVMLHRRSIFDLATLEALAAGCPTILSRTSGNLDFDLDHACLLVDEGAEEQAAGRLARADLTTMGAAARATFERHFSHTPYLARYRQAFTHLLENRPDPKSPCGFSRFFRKLWTGID